MNTYYVLGIVIGVEQRTNGNESLPFPNALTF